MITKLTLRNFKSVGEQVYDFTRFDLIVGRNNSGKSTVLQALAIWQYCVDEFHRSKRTGSTGIQVVLPNFTALPVPEFILLWKDKTDRAYPLDKTAGKKKQEFILIEILVEWQEAADAAGSFGVQLRYQSPQTIYAIPAGGWAGFRALNLTGKLPRIAYVPPFSGLEPTEKYLDKSPMRQQVGKGQPGSVLRNLLLRVSQPQTRDSDEPVRTQAESASDWKEIADIVRRWFSVKISPPSYESTKDVYITVEYAQSGKDYDIISGGSGFHQTLTLLAFLYGYRPTTILLDEPDAHLHVNLQRAILDYFKRKSFELGTQFLIATHAEEFVRGVAVGQIVSLLDKAPRRVESNTAVIQAMSDLSNEEVTRLLGTPYIVYVEGEDDERILRAWAGACGAQAAIDKICFKTMGGGSKKSMQEQAHRHFSALQQIIPGAKRWMLFDFDDETKAFHPAPDNPTLTEWRRRNIENYLLVPSAWQRAVLRQLDLAKHPLFAEPTLRLIDTFFADQNLTLPPGRNWRNLTANVFTVVDGKRILFEDSQALFHQLKASDPSVTLNREQIALAMTTDEIHDDVHAFIAKLRTMTGAA